MAFLEIKDLRKNFGETQVLKGINFELNKGEVVSVIGASGNGKTTLLRCLNFLEIADSGEVIVDGVTIFPAKRKVKSSAKLGMVFQNYNLFPQYTALRNVTLAMDIKSKRDYKEQLSALKKEYKGKLKEANLSEKEDKNQLIAQLKEEFSSKKAEIITAKKGYKKSNKEKALEILDRVGLSDKISFYPCQLSGGQQQRVAIARALALSPDILCFDEPTSALDPELTREVLKVIKSLRQEGRTMIIVTHEMAFARDVSDKIVFMANGQIEEQGAPEQIFDNPQSELTKAFLLLQEDDGAND